MGDAGPTWWFLDDPKAAAAARAACLSEPEWLDEADVIEDDPPADDEELPTRPGLVLLRAPIAMAGAASITAPRRRDALPLRKVLLASAVALVFVLGWWLGGRHNPPGAPAATIDARLATRSVGCPAVRIPAPEPESLPPPRPTTSPPVATPWPRRAVTPSPAPSAYDPTDL